MNLTATTTVLNTTEPARAQTEERAALTATLHDSEHLSATEPVDTATPHSDESEPEADTDRWAHVHTLLHDDSIRRYVRIAGLFMLLFAQTVTNITRMRAAQVDTSDPARVFVTFERTPVEMPEPLSQLLREQLADRGQASYASSTNQWLFPGGIPGRHLVTENIRAQLVDLGIRPHSARHAAMFALAAQVPHMILAQTLGISNTAALTWAALAARDWSSYIAQRSD